MNVLLIAALVVAALTAVAVAVSSMNSQKEGLRPYGAPKDMKCLTIETTKRDGVCPAGLQEVPGNHPSQQCIQWGWVHKENGACPLGYMPYPGSNDKCQRNACGTTRNNETNVLQEFEEKCAKKKINGVSRYKGWNGTWYCPKDRPWDAVTNAIMTVNGIKLDRNETRINTAAGRKISKDVACWSQKDLECAKALRRALKIPGLPEYRVEPPKPNPNDVKCAETCKRAGYCNHTKDAAGVERCCNKDKKPNCVYMPETGCENTCNRKAPAPALCRAGRDPATKDMCCPFKAKPGVAECVYMPGKQPPKPQPPKPQPPKQSPPPPPKPPAKGCEKLCAGTLKLCQGGTNNTCCTAKHIPADGKTLPWTLALAASNAAACAKIPDFSWQGTACLPKECRSRGDAGCEYMCSKFGKCTKNAAGLCCNGTNCSAAVGASDPGCEYRCIQGGKCTADGKGNCCNAAGCVPAADKGCEQPCTAVKQCKADGKGNCCDTSNKCGPRPRGKRNLSNFYGSSMGGSAFSYSCPTPGSYATKFVVGYDNSPNEIKHITMDCSDGKSSGRQGRRISRVATDTNPNSRTAYETSKPMTPAPGQTGFQRAYLVTDYEGKKDDRVRAFGVDKSYVFGTSWNPKYIKEMDCGYFGPGYRITGINGATGSGMDRLQFECSDVAP